MAPSPDPWQTPEQRAAWMDARRKRWLASLSARDRARIRDLIRQAMTGELPARIDDLDARGIAVGACPPGWETRFSGEVVQAIKIEGKVVAYVLVWEK